MLLQDRLFLVFYAPYSTLWIMAVHALPLAEPMLVMCIFGNLVPNWSLTLRQFHHQMVCTSCIWHNKYCTIHADICRSTMTVSVNVKNNNHCLEQVFRTHAKCNIDVFASNVSMCVIYGKPSMLALKKQQWCSQHPNKRLPIRIQSLMVDVFYVTLQMMAKRWVNLCISRNEETNRTQRTDSWSIKYNMRKGILRNRTLTCVYDLIGHVHSHRAAISCAT